MSSDDHRDSDLQVSDIAQHLIDFLGGSVQWNSRTDITIREELDVHLRPPLPDSVRFCVTNLIFSSRESEYKINARMPEQEAKDTYHPNRSDGYFVIIGGYNEEADVWAFWDDSLRDTYSNNPSIQVKEETVEKAISDGFAVQAKDRAKGETAVVVKSENLNEAIKLRYRFVRNRRILSELLHDDWRSSGARAQVVERIADIVLEETDPNRPMSERRNQAIRQVATERGNDPKTVRGKLKGDLFPNKEQGSEGYIPSCFDPLLRDLEDAIRTPVDNIQNGLLDYIEEVRTETAIYVVSMPPEEWIVSCYYNSVPVNQNKETIRNGDVILFYLNEDSDVIGSKSYETGIIGGAVAGTSRQKDDSDNRWRDEFMKSENYSYITDFQRVFYTGEPVELDLETTIKFKDESDIQSETHSLTENIFDENKADEILGVNFPPKDRVKELVRGSDPYDLEPARELVRQIAKNLVEAPSVNIYADYEGIIEDEMFEGLHLPEQQSDIQAQVNSALRTGKHIIFTGPPGTGKTEIASNIAEQLQQQFPWQFSGSQITTATADWSTFDTLGGYMPEEESDGGDRLSFKSGILLNRLKNDRTFEQRNELVVIDELNRANIDEAFGQMFTVLSGESVQLQYTRDGNELEIITADDLEGMAKPNQYVVPSSWRILATMNTFDKNSLYEMSYAFMRRFSFITVNDPFQERDYDTETDLENLMQNYDTHWETGAGSDQQLSVAKVWRATNSAVDGRAIGPAIVKDMLEGVVEMVSTGLELEEALTSVVLNYIFPQMEGVRGRETVINKIKNVDEIHGDKIKRAAKDRLDVEFEDNE